MKKFTRDLILSIVCLFQASSGHANVYYVINNSDNGNGSLREKIDSADDHIGYDSILFNIPDGSVSARTIHLLDKIQINNGDILIDGTSQIQGNTFGLSAAKIFLKGHLTEDGLHCNGGNNVTVFGLVLDSFYYGLYGIHSVSHIGLPGKGNVFINCYAGGVSGAGDSVFVQSNWFGLDTLMNPAPNYDGIKGSNLIIGGTNINEGNKIAFNLSAGISAERSIIQGNEIYNNYKGIYISFSEHNFLIGSTISDAGGNYIHNNTYGGIDIAYSDTGRISGNHLISNATSLLITYSSQIAIGGTNLERNVIDSAIGDGISILYSDTIYLLGNRISNSTGAGISIYYSKHIQVGDNQGNGNLISGNTGNGIELHYSDSSTIKGNLIGTDSTGLLPFGNAEDGINVTYSYGEITIGGNKSKEGNVISSNGSNGIWLNSKYMQVLGNKIGVGIDGITALGNGLNGVLILYGYLNEIIGNGSDTASNTIAYNGSNGVSSYTITIRNNSIFCNTLKGITTNNASGVIPPDILYYSPAGISGVAKPNAIIEVFQNHFCEDDCEGKTFLGSCIADTNGNFYLGESLTGVITATQTDTAGITSEFSICIEVDTLATGIFLPDESYRVSVTPNPITRYCTIALNSTLQIPFSIELRSIDGTLLFQNIFNSQHINLDVSDFPAGIYMIIVKSDEYRDVLKIVKE